MHLCDWILFAGLINLLFTYLDAAQLFAQENYLTWPHAAYKCLDNRIGPLVNLDISPIDGAEWDTVITVNDDNYWTGGYYSNTDFYWKYGCYDLNDILNYGLYSTQSVHLFVPNSLPDCVEKCLGDYSAKYVGLMGITCYCITEAITTLRRYTSNCTVICSAGINDNCGTDGHVSVYELLDQVQITTKISTLKANLGQCVALRKVSGNLMWEAASCSDSKNFICGKETYTNSTTITKLITIMKPLSWREANAECMKEGMKLAKVTSMDSAALPTIPDDVQFWIGLYRGRIFRWIEGDAPVSETDRCVAVRRNSKSSTLERVEEACDQLYKFVCQKFEDAKTVESAVIGTPTPTTVTTITTIQPTTTTSRTTEKETTTTQKEPTTIEQTTEVPTTTKAKIPTTEKSTDQPTSTLSQTTVYQTTEIKHTSTKQMTTTESTTTTESVTTEITTPQVTTSKITTLEITTPEKTTLEKTTAHITTQEITTANEKKTPELTTKITTTPVATTQGTTAVEDTIDLVEGSKDIIVIELVGEKNSDDKSVEAAIARHDASSESDSTTGTKTELIVILVVLMTIFLIVCIIVIVMLVRYRRSHQNTGYTMRPHKTDIQFEGQEELFIKEYRRSAEQANPSPKPVPRIDVDDDESLEKVLVTIEPQNSYQRYQSNETLDIPWIDASRNTLDNISGDGSIQAYKKDELTSFSEPALDKVGADRTENASGQNIQVVSTDL